MTESDTTVAWFLFATDAVHVCSQSQARRARLEWVELDQAVEADDAGLAPQLRRARAVVARRRAASSPFSPTLATLIRRFAEEASDILSDVPGAGVGLCGSGARGDFIDGWSDVDLIGWGMEPSSTTAQQLEDLAGSVGRDCGVHASLDFADAAGRDAVDGDPLFTMKLQALLHNSALEVPVLAGSRPPEPPMPVEDGSLRESIDRLLRFAVRHLASEATTSRARADRARRVLSVACNVGRRIATSLAPQSSPDLRKVAEILEGRWPGNPLVPLLIDYSEFRRHGATDITTAEGLASTVPEALRTIQRLAT